MKHVELATTNLFGVDFTIEKGRILTADELWSAKYIVSTFLPPSEVLMAERLNASAISEKNLKDCPLTVEEKAEMFVPEFPVKNRDKRAKSRNGKALEGRKHKGCVGSNYGWKKYNSFCKEQSRKVSDRNFKEHWQEELPEDWDACDYFWRNKEQEDEIYRDGFPHGDYICDPVKGYDCPENKEINEHISHLVHEEELPEHEHDYDWDYADYYDEEEDDTRDDLSGDDYAYNHGFEAGKQYVIDLLKAHGITVDLSILDSVK